MMGFPRMYGKSFLKHWVEIMKQKIAVLGFVFGVFGLSGNVGAQSMLLKNSPPLDFGNATAIDAGLPAPVTDLSVLAPPVDPLSVVSKPRAIEGPETFFRATPVNFSKAVMKFGAVMLDDPQVIDGYARVAYCDLVRRYIGNEFEWTKIRTGIRKSVEAEKTGYPYRFVYTDQIQLGNYDFARKGFAFSSQTPLRGIGNIVIDGGIDNGCVGRNGLQRFPTQYRIVFSTPVSLDMLPMLQGDGERLLARMKTRGNSRRTIYIRFNFEVRDVRLSDVLTDPNFSTGDLTANFSSRLHSIDFFEDKDEKMLLGSWTPQTTGR